MKVSGGDERTREASQGQECQKRRYIVESWNGLKGEMGVAKTFKV
jgi:hypothetical protein